ncbi:MAG TPA: hypothetical protein VFB14_10390 [Bryobacteraceae bacterium]|nr:hypothetical protein [Bryobacteraceae bacterium]
MKPLTTRLCTALFAATAALTGTSFLFAQDNSNATGGKGAQVAALYRLQAAFHRAATVRDPVNGDSDEVINERLRAMLSLWTDNGWTLINLGSPRDGYYIGNGDPSDASTCPAPSDNYANRGTLCTFFKYVAGSFQPANKFVSLAPSYKTEIHVYGTDATLYFECHYFNVAMDPATGKPLWVATSHIAFDGAATKVGNRWLLSHSNGLAAGIPVP